jgi:PAS domain S-box-containing protein
MDNTHLSPLGIPDFTSAAALLSAIIDSTDDAIISKDLCGVITSWNRGAERIFGYAAAEMIGHPITEIIPPERQSEETAILAQLRRGERVDHFETRRLRKDGQIVEVSLTISPIRNPAGDVVGASKIARDITLQRRATERLREVAEEAERQSRMKDEFLATLSHELRTPLQSILGWIQLLRGDDVRADELQQGLEVIDRNAQSQIRIIDDLLDMSRILSGKVRLDVQRVQLAPLIEAALETVKPAAEAKGIRLIAILDPLAKPVAGDPNRLQQIFWNLLSNAMKFTPRGGRVQVLLERVNSHVEVSVIDTGSGISPEFLPYVFERFRQADASTTRQHGGLGLGLAIVKHLVELHGGTARAKSGGLAEGATFTITFPVTAVRGEPEEQFRHPDAASRAAPTVRASLSNISVLVVDDEEDTRFLLARTLSKAGADVQTAPSAEIALEMLKARVPDVLVSDVGMPTEDGYSLIRSVRKLPPDQGGDVPAIALTAYTRTEDRIRTISEGFQMHLAKPADSREFLAIVERLARKSNLKGLPQG